MVFNSTAFLVFFPLFFLAFLAMQKRAGLRLNNLFLLLASYFFYGWWDWRFLSLIFVSSAVDYGLGLAIHGSLPPGRRKWLLACSVLVNLGILGFFKYFNFFADSLARLFALLHLPFHTATLDIILPVGISFYTFQTLSYTIDIYRRKIEPTRDWIAFFAFISFFPQLVAGPIERAQHLLPQFLKPRQFRYDEAVRGLRLVLWGFFKKVAIADNLGLVVDGIFAPGAEPGTLAVVMGAVLFSFQIYCDFSGYSDIAIGLGRMLGFQLTTNFRTPYFAASFTEFWHRWHITLSTWFRDYVFIPLGGSRGSQARAGRNLMATFLLSGLWHGAHVNFLIWGGLHGLALLAEKRTPWKAPAGLAIPFTFMAVSLLWLPFRAATTSQFWEMSRSLFYWTAGGTSPADFLSVLPPVKAAALAVILPVFLGLEYAGDRWEKVNRPVRWGFYYLLVLAILFFGNFDVKPYFIYFQF